MTAAPIGSPGADPGILGMPPSSAFALLHRPGAGTDRVEILVGEPEVVRTLAELPLTADGATGGDGHELLAVLPFRQISERGLRCVDDHEPLIAMRVAAQARMPVEEALRRLPTAMPALDGGGFDVPDDEYATIVRHVLDRSIGRGDGSNFVVRRSFRAAFDGWSRSGALALFRRLLLAERGAYWTFVVHFNGRTLAGATPERHLRLDDGVATMTPISGTYRYPPSGPDTAGLLRFLDDRKEAAELLMVVDEELKMMARVCDGGGRVHGPWVRPMSRLAHTEYVIDGRTGLDVRELLRHTTPAPTVTGSPVASACEVIADRERTGRGYYGGVLALVGRHRGRRTLDSALIIRTADIDAGGRVSVAVGATLVRGSDPRAEAAETRAKAAALIETLRAPGTAPAPSAGRMAVGDARVRSALRARNDGLSHFWRGRGAVGPVPPELAGRRLLLVDADDDFTAMLARMAEQLGVVVRIRRWDAEPDGAYDAVLVGPGPGDPGDRADPRIARLHDLVRGLLETRTPMLAVCLGHQVLAAELGLTVTRLGEPEQGVRRTIDWCGRPESVGFYNSFAAVSDTDVLHSPLVPGPVRVLRQSATGVVHALVAARIRAAQFHLESLLTEHGPDILREMLISVLAYSHDPELSPVFSPR
ncbi:phenazine-specific anthranilate synthase component I [Actinoplanes sp. ATCC 53533]|uniref:anthranilate synthase family protein n=1 Tax=Actinoplanes sp. ATCC 53533 TaxID=1288362 RepID=UPI000F79337A|nr:anthranilate synthase family protein [Actinoplanes sp. ATCC 53533]RSM46506.1 phenazine-specific anthranilate synthase component I [Actinoplanes sp. ATCC 53533]